MLPLLQQYGSQRQGPQQQALRRVFSSKGIRGITSILTLVGLSFLLLAGLQTSTGQRLKASFRTAHPERPKGRLHFLIPATSSNSDLCKLLLSAQILNYPTPILINYGAQEDMDEYVQHLAKVEGILKYLEHVETSSEYAEDLVLIVDGYDVWFQLRPDVLIKRYYAVNAAADSRALETYGKDLVRAHGIGQTILFGPDKICWPIDWSRPACWAVPQATLPKFAFGPQTSGGREELNMPQWLNSGTIMGPTKHLRDMFRATLEAIHANHTTDSDQFYFANIFGEQEYARIRRKPEVLEERKNVRYSYELNENNISLQRLEPNISEDTNAEYHIGIDYTSTLFQTVAFWKLYMTWVRAIDAWAPSQPAASSHNPSRNSYNLSLAIDIRDSDPPYEALRQKSILTESKWPSWEEAELNYNVVTNEMPVMVHFTGEKQFREIWWQKVWFQSRAQELRLASVASKSQLISSQPIGGLMWNKAELAGIADVSYDERGGSWSDAGSWLGWNMLCKDFESELYHVPGDDLFHKHSGDPGAKQIDR